MLEAQKSEDISDSDSMILTVKRHGNILLLWKLVPCLT